MRWRFPTNEVTSEAMPLTEVADEVAFSPDVSSEMMPSAEVADELACSPN